MDQVIRNVPSYAILAWPYTIIVGGSFLAWYLAVAILHAVFDKAVTRLTTTPDLERWGKANRRQRHRILLTENLGRIKLRRLTTQLGLPFAALIFIWMDFGALFTYSFRFVGAPPVPAWIRGGMAASFILWATLKWVKDSLDMQHRLVEKLPGIFRNSIPRLSQVESLNPVILRTIAQNPLPAIVFFSTVISVANIQTLHSTTEAGAALVGGFIGLVLGSGQAWKYVDHRMPQSVLIEALLQYWIPIPTRHKDPAAVYALDLIDPSAPWRPRVQKVLDVAGATLPGLSKILSSAEHPVLRNLAALQREIAIELRKPQSLTSEPPAKITQSLRDMAIVIYGRQTSEYHERLSARLAPLHMDYSPPSFSIRLKDSLRNFSSGIEQANVSGKALAYLALLGLSIFWFLQDGDFSKLDPIFK